MPSIKEILDTAGIPNVGAEHKHGRDGWVQVDCVFCGSVGKFHLGISEVTGASSCWRCGKQNTATALSLLGVSDRKTCRKILNNANLVKSQIRVRGKLKKPKALSELGPTHETYLRKRGFNPKKIQKLWGIRATPSFGTLAWRIWIPIIYHGNTVSWTTRSIAGNSFQRYISAAANEETVPHKHILYGADYAKHAIIIHEGPLDVWATGPGAVATCGTAYTPNQILAMSRYLIRVVCFDSSDNAQRRARQLANELCAYPGETHLVCLETGEDAAAASQDELREIRNKFLKG